MKVKINKIVVNVNFNHQNNNDNPLINLANGVLSGIARAAEAEAKQRYDKPEKADYSFIDKGKKRPLKRVRSHTDLIPGDEVLIDPIGSEFLKAHGFVVDVEIDYPHNIHIVNSLDPSIKGSTLKFNLEDSVIYKLLDSPPKTPPSDKEA